MKNIGPYRIVDGPFEGGFGQVYRVFDPNSGDELALKTIKGSFLSTAERLRRFRREIDLWMEIPTHPNVVRALKAFDHGGRPCVLIEWIGGGDLRSRIPSLVPDEQDPLNLLNGAARALEVMCQVCAGMNHIHRQGLAHGDLKPSNVMMWGGGSPQITDFGFARAAAEDHFPSAGGTTRYMAPELDLRSANVSTDIYAAGVMFLEMLESFKEGQFGVSQGREIARTMTSRDPARRPASFAEVEERVNAMIDKAPFPPSAGRRIGPRLTWDEQHASVIPESASLDQARSLLTAGRRHEARAKLESLVFQQPKRADARILLANCLIDGGDAELAVEHLLAAEKAARETPDRLITIASLLSEAGRIDEANRIVRALAKNEEQLPRLWSLQGRIAEIEGNLSDAIDFYRKALDASDSVVAEDSKRVRFGLARALKDAGFLEQAVAEFSSIGKDDVDLGIKVSLLLAAIYTDTERYDEAVRELRESLKKDIGVESERYVYTQLGYVYKAQQLYDAAIHSYKRALSLDGAYQPAKEGLSQSIAARDQRARVEETDFSEVFVQPTGSPIDARAAYEALTTFERRFEEDRLEDFVKGVYKVSWTLLTNEFVIPQLERTGRVSESEARLLHEIRKRSRRQPEEREDGVKIYPDVYELLLTLYQVIAFSEENFFRAHANCMWRWTPSLFRGGPGSSDLAFRLDRTCGFLTGLSSREEYRELAETDDREKFLGLVAIAQCCGLPTHLFEFTGDMRAAAFYAADNGRPGDIGEIVLLPRHQFAEYADIAEGPYGRMIQPALPATIRRKRSLFIAGFVPSVLRDPATTFLERHYFRQDGRPFPSAGGYGWDDLMKGTNELAAIVQKASPKGVPSSALQQNLDWFRAQADQPSYDSGETGDDFANDAQYTRACDYTLLKTLSPDAKWIDQRVAKLFADIQIDIHAAKLRSHIGHALRSRYAMDTYLQAEGDIEERLGLALRTTWLDATKSEEQEVVDQIIDKNVNQFAKDVKAD